MKPKVVKVIYQSYLPVQGRYPRTSGQAHILARNGFEVTVLACDREGDNPLEEELEGIHVVRLRESTGEMRGPFRQLLPLLRFWFRAFFWLRRHPFDILHVHNLDVVPLGAAVRLFLRRPVVFESHEPNYYALWPRKWAWLLGIVEGVERMLSRRMSAISVTNLIQVEKYRAMGHPRVVLIGNYARPELRVRKLPEEKFDRPGVIFGRFGTIYPNTGFEATLEALAQVVKVRPETRMVIAGRVVENYRETFHRLLEPVKEHVEYLGAYSAADMPDLYRRVDVSLLIYPRSEWFRNITPRKFFDSLANAVPVIMTDIGGLGPVIREREMGLVVSDTDIDDIAAAMLRCIEEPGLVRHMAEQALHQASTEYSWEEMERQYVALQNALLPPPARTLEEKSA